MYVFIPNKNVKFKKKMIVIVIEIAKNCINFGGQSDPPIRRH